MVDDWTSPAARRVWRGERWTVIEGDALAVLRDLPSDLVDAVITDPPYSSGGMMRTDRARRTSEKYQNSGSGRILPDFDGDNKDQRAYTAWSAIWMGEARRVTVERGTLLAFSDWRQLPATTDAIQAGGWVLRPWGVWRKPPSASRPAKGGFWLSNEYVLHASNGPLRADDWSPCLPGVIDDEAPPTRTDRLHIAQKPAGLMRLLCTLAPAGGVVLDPFGGSGSTGAAALAEGRRCIVIEAVPEWAALCADRLAAVEAGADLDAWQAGQEVLPW